ncbi:MAG: DUF1569 domain-containing protein [Planctomycetes bacterium]|nr:DUF1569 domain-containing protein [Planctomycetota bacterium]
MRDLPDPTSDTPTLAALRAAFDRLEPASRPRWGRMDAAQMLLHCRTFVDLCLGRVPVALPMRLLARALGPLFLRRLFARSPKEAPKDLTTLKPLRMDAAQADLDTARRELGQRFDELEALPAQHRHPLYGRMRRQDVIALVRHHTAHHANQFGLLDG